MDTIVDSGVKERVVFHFNKAHLADKEIPMWVIKHKGSSYYVNHVVSEVGWSTKETPDNSHTQGSILLRGNLLITREGNQTTAYVRAI